MQNQKPIILELDEARQELAQCVNNIMQAHSLNCYLMEPIFADLYSQMRVGAQNELAQARAQMAAQNVADSTK